MRRSPLTFVVVLALVTALVPFAAFAQPATPAPSGSAPPPPDPPPPPPGQPTPPPPPPGPADSPDAPPTPPPPAPTPPPPPPGPKPDAKEIDDARSRMEKGQRLFADGKFTEATTEFSSAYDTHKFSAFLFNAAVAAERGGSRDKAIDFYERFLKSEPNAPDRAEIEKTVERLKKEQATAAPPAPISQKAEIKSLVFIESDPEGAPVSIYEKVDPKAPLLDPKRPDQPGYRRVVTGLTAPANTSLAFGTYFIVVEGFRDYNPTGSQLTLEAGRVYVYRAGLSQGDFVGRVEISVPVAQAQIFVDDPPPHKSAPRATGTNAIELTPGKHTLWIEAPGFVRFEKEIDIVQGKTIKVDAQLERVAYGYLLVSGDAEEVEVEIDGEDIGVYEKRKGEPLRIRVPAGEHEIEVDASGRKAYDNVMTIPRGQEIAIDAKLEEAPGKGGAVVTTILAAGSIAGAVVLNRYVANLSDDNELKKPLNAVSIGCFVGAGIFTGLSIFLFAWDPGEDSSAKIIPAREFTGETESPAVKPVIDASLGPRIDVKMVVGTPSLPDAVMGNLAPSSPTGLVVEGRF